MISQFSLDWIARNFYFLDATNNLIFVCSYEMKFCRIIVRSLKVDAVVKLQALALDPDAGFLFVTKHNPRSRSGAAILRYSMSGTNAISLVNDKLFFPKDLTLDVATKKIYFLDQYFDFIQQCDYDGSNRIFLQKLPLMKFHRIATFENRFFAAIHNNLSIVQIREGAKSVKRAATESLDSQPKILKIFHSQIQPVNPRYQICATNNKCEHLCIPGEMNRSTSRPTETCLCGEGFRLENGKCKLQKAGKYLMFVQDFPRTLKAVDVDTLDAQVLAPILGLRSNVAFDVDLINHTIYFTSYLSLNSSEANTIEFRSFNGSRRGVLKGNFDPIQSMAFDWVGKNLYITSQSPKPKISAIKVLSDPDKDAMERTLISKDLTGPCSLALDPENGKWFMYLWGEFINHVTGILTTMIRVSKDIKLIFTTKKMNF